MKLSIYRSLTVHGFGSRLARPRHLGAPPHVQVRARRPLSSRSYQKAVHWIAKIPQFGFTRYWFHIQDIQELIRWVSIISRHASFSCSWFLKLWYSKNDSGECLFFWGGTGPCKATAQTSRRALRDFQDLKGFQWSIMCPEIKRFVLSVFMQVWRSSIIAKSIVINRRNVWGNPKPYKTNKKKTL